MTPGIVGAHGFSCAYARLAEIRQWIYDIVALPFFNSLLRKSGSPVGYTAVGALAISLSASGCTVTTSGGCCLLGPTILRISPPEASDGHPGSSAAVIQTRRFPLDFEAGDQWAIRLGYTESDLFPAIPLTTSREDTGAAILEDKAAPAGVAREHAAPDSVPWSVMVLAKCLRTNGPVVFGETRHYGLQIGTGVRENGFCLGISETAVFSPEPNAGYLVDYSSADPQSSRVKTWR